MPELQLTERLLNLNLQLTSQSAVEKHQDSVFSQFLFSQPSQGCILSLQKAKEDTREKDLKNRLKPIQISHVP